MSTVSEGVKSPLICQSSHMPLFEAVSIVPCNHKIQECVAKKFFGPELIDGWKIPKGLSCPICETPAKGYLVDNEMRALAANVFSPDYPGERSIFIHKKGNFKISEVKADRCRIMKFESSSKTALIRKFEVIGYKDGLINIWMQFDSAKSNEFKKFFGTSDLDPRSQLNLIESGRYRTIGKKNLRNTFKLVANNNTFPAKQLEKLNRIIAAGKKAPMRSQGTESLFSEMPFGFPGFGGLTGNPLIDLITLQRREMQTKPEKISYPGKSAIFAHTKGDWEPFEPKQDLCREICFKSTTADSLITEFSLLGYKRGSVQIRLDFASSNAANLEKFFAGISDKVQFTFAEKASGIYRATKRDLKIVFDVMKAHNTFPEELLAKMEAIVEKGEIERLPGVENNEEPECITQ